MLQGNLIPLPRTKLCTKCRKALPVEQFYRDRAGRDGLNPWCKSCFQAGVLRYAKTPRGREVRGKTNRRNRRTVRGRANALWHAAKRRSENSGLDFTLTVEWIRDRIATGHCELSGAIFDYSEPGRKSTGNPYAPSIDRIDSHRGYTQDNCRVICWALNVAFGHWGEEIFLKLYREYLAYNKKEIL